MKCYKFTIHYHYPAEVTEEVLDAIYEAGCDDALLCRIDGCERASFDREAETFADAVFSAMRDLKKVPGLTIVKVEAENDDDLHDVDLINRTIQIERETASA